MVQVDVGLWGSGSPVYGLLDLSGLGVVWDRHYDTLADTPVRLVSILGFVTG